MGWVVRKLWIACISSCQVNVAKGFQRVQLYNRYAEYCHHARNEPFSYYCLQKQKLEVGRRSDTSRNLSLMQIIKEEKLNLDYEATCIASTGKTTTQQSFKKSRVTQRNSDLRLSVAMFQDRKLMQFCNKNKKIITCQKLYQRSSESYLVLQ